MTGVMVGDAIFVCLFLLASGLLYYGSQERTMPAKKWWLALILVSVIYALLYKMCNVHAADLQKQAQEIKETFPDLAAKLNEAAKNLGLYRWFVLGIFASIFYSYCYLPEVHGPHDQPKKQFNSSTLAGVLTVIIGIASFFLDTIYTNALYIGAFGPLATVSTSLGATLMIAATIEYEKLNPEHSVLHSFLSIFTKNN